MTRTAEGAFKIGDRLVEQDTCFIVAEVAQAHDGSLGMAHAFIDAIANAGADAVKFQTHIAEAESTPEESWRVKFSSQDATRFDYWKRMEFTETQWKSLAQHAKERGLVFLSSAFSLEAVNLLIEVGVPAWKIASGEVSNGLLLEKIAETHLPVLLSTGMSPLAEVDAAVSLLASKGLPIVVLQCTSAYPCPPEKVGLNLISFFNERYGTPVGLSDHSGTIYPGLAAATIGVAVLEVHVTLSREMFGPDVPVSLTTAELRQLVEGVGFIKGMRSHPLDKDIVAQEMTTMRKLFTKSVAARQNLKAGTRLEAKHLTTMKPGAGIPANELSKLIGRRLRRDVKRHTLFNLEDIEWSPKP